MQPGDYSAIGAADEDHVPQYMDAWSDWPCGAPAAAAHMAPFAGATGSAMRECRVMSDTLVALPARTHVVAGDPHDRALVRHMLALTPTERLRNVSAFWPVARLGLQRRQRVSGACRS